ASVSEVGLTDAPAAAERLDVAARWAGTRIIGHSDGAADGSVGDANLTGVAGRTRALPCIGSAGATRAPLRSACAGHRSGGAGPPRPAAAAVRPRVAEGLPNPRRDEQHHERDGVKLMRGGIDVNPPVTVASSRTPMSSIHAWRRASRVCLQPRLIRAH